MTIALDQLMQLSNVAIIPLLIYVVTIERRLTEVQTQLKIIMGRIEAK